MRTMRRLAVRPSARRRTLAASAAGAALLAAALAAAPALPQAPAPATLSWTRLEYKAFLSSAHVEVRALPAAEAEASWITPSGDTALSGRGAEVLRMSLRFKVPLSSSELELWLDPGDGRALQRSERDRKDRHKTYRFAEDGVFLRLASPADRSQRSLPPGRWTAVEEATYSHELGGEAPAPVTEPPALLYLVSCADLSPAAGPRTVRMWFKKRLYDVELEAFASDPIKVGFRETRAGASEKRKGRLDVWRVAVRPRPVGDATGSEDFRFLGLRGDIAIFVARDSRLPVRIRGEMKLLGEVDIDLKEASLGGDAACAAATSETGEAG